MIIHNAISLLYKSCTKRSSFNGENAVWLAWKSIGLTNSQPKRAFNLFIPVFFLGLFFASTAASAQNLTPSDSLFLAKLRTELQLPDTTLSQIDSIYKAPITRLQEIDKEVNRIARTDIPQSEKDARFVNLRAEKKSLKEDRDLSILRLLNAEQQTIYTTKVVPPKPAVLHMGTNHDRASCTVCVKPQ